MQRMANSRELTVSARLKVAGETQTIIRVLALPPMESDMIIVSLLFRLFTYALGLSDERSQAGGLAHRGAQDKKSSGVSQSSPPPLRTPREEQCGPLLGGKDPGAEMTFPSSNRLSLMEVASWESKQQSLSDCWRLGIDTDGRYATERKANESPPCHTLAVDPGRIEGG